MCTYMKRHLIIAIDPGATGAIAFCVMQKSCREKTLDVILDKFGEHDVKADSRVRIKDLGNNRVQVIESIKDVLDLCAPFASCSVYIEKSFVMPGTAVDAAETYMRHYGNIEAALLCFGVPEQSLHEIDPHDWQKHYPMLVPERARKGEAQSRASRRKIIKEHSRKIAIQLFPYLSSAFSRVRDDGRADAALILRYACMRESGTLDITPSNAETARRENHGKRKKRGNRKHKSSDSGNNNATITTISTTDSPDGKYPPF